MATATHNGAIFTFNASSSFFFDAFFFDAFFSADMLRSAVQVLSQSPTTIIVRNTESNVVTTIAGLNLALSGLAGLEEAAGGTITSFTMRDGVGGPIIGSITGVNFDFVEFSDAVDAAANDDEAATALRALFEANGPVTLDGSDLAVGLDLLSAFSNPNIVPALGSPLTVLGSQGDDVLVGGLGNDTINSGGSEGFGFEILLGSQGSDTYVFESPDEGSVNLLAYVDFFSGIDLDLQIEDGVIANIDATDDQDDTVIKASGTDVLVNVGGVLENGSLFFIGTSSGDNITILTAPDQVVEIISDAGDDTIETGAGTETISGGAGRDSIDAGGGGDFIEGGSGFDTIFGGSGFDTIVGDGGNDVIFGGTEADFLFGEAGNDLLEGGQGFDQLFGGAGNDTLLSGETADRVFGGTGDDLIRGGSSTGFTKDGLFGEAGNDTIFGDSGFDVVDGGAGDDSLDGGDQADNVFGRDGEDTLLGGNGLDRLFGGNDDDIVRGGAGNDGVFGGFGNDSLFGDAGTDRLFGEVGNDILDGGAGNDTLIGNAGFDTLIAGAGDDELFGRFNADRFVFSDGHGNDTIGDFDALNIFERIDLSGVSAISDLGDLAVNNTSGGAAIQAGQDVIIDTGGGNQIVLVNVTLSDLDASDFVF